MNNEQKQLFKKIEAFPLDQPDVDLPFSQRLATENSWNLEYTNQVIAEYKKFVFLAVVAGHIVTPSEQIDRVWHLHLTYTRSYWDEFCPQVLGKPLHHQPTEGGQSESEKYDDLYRQTLSSYRKFFGTQAPQAIWSSPDVRFGKDLAYKRINTQENWIISKPKLPLVATKIVSNLTPRFNQITTVIVSILLIILITLGTTLPGLAQNAPFYWDFLNIQLDVQDNGDLLVTEEQKYVFTGTHSPERYRFINLNSIKAIKDVQVFEDNHLLPVETTTQGNKFWIKWQEYLDNQDIHTFVLRYRAVGAVTNSYGVDKLNWKAIFPYRQAAINNSEITINLPESLAGKVKNHYSDGGNFKSNIVDDSTIKFASLQSLASGKSAVIKLIFSGHFLHLDRTNTESVALKPTSDNLAENFVGYSIVGVVLLILVGMVILFVYIVFSAITGNLPRDKSNSSGGCSGSCGGGGGGSCGGGCGGGG